MAKKTKKAAVHGGEPHQGVKNAVRGEPPPGWSGRAVHHGAEEAAHPGASRRVVISGSRKGSSDLPGHAQKPRPDRNPHEAAVAAERKKRIDEAAWARNE